MELRDQLAISAMSVFVQDLIGETGPERSVVMEKVARASYEMADVMLRIRNNSPQSGITSKDVLTVLQTQPFADFYNDDMDMYIRGDEDAPPQEYLLREISRIFQLPS